jgi:acetolactate synthase I/II/III large subunit
LNVSEFIIESVSNQGTKHVFLVPGQHIDPFISSMQKTTKIEPVLCVSETGAGFIADGSARFSEHIGFIATIGGPGLANLLPAMMTSKIEQSPLIIISGVQPSNLEKWPVFQNSSVDGTKDIEWAGILCKYAERVQLLSELEVKLEFALETALMYPRGPVFLQIPYDFFDMEINTNPIQTCQKKHDFVSDDIIKELQIAMSESASVAIYVGSTHLTHEQKELLKQLIEIKRIPIFTTLDLKGVISELHPLNKGVLGFGGNIDTEAIQILDTVETVFVFGVMLNDRNTYSWEKSLFKGKKKMIYINHHFPDVLKQNWIDIDFVQGNPGVVLQKIALQIIKENQSPKAVSFSQDPVLEKSKLTLLQSFVKKIRDWVKEETPVFVDAGSLKEFMGKNWMVTKPNTFFISPEIGSMGWAIGAGIGASLENGEEGSIVFTGDGSMGMHGLELATSVKYKTPITVFVLNNGYLKSVKDRHDNDDKKILCLPDIHWSNVAKGIGMNGYRVYTESDLEDVLGKIDRNSQNLIELMIVGTD